MPNPTNSDEDHAHHKECPRCIMRCQQCIREATPLGSPMSAEDIAKDIFMKSRSAMIKAGPGGPGANTYKRPTYRHTAKPPYIDFEKQRELVPGEVFNIEPGITYTAPKRGEDGNPVITRLTEKLVTCRITFEDREPERSDSGKAITIHQCEAHLVIITWDES